MIDAVPAANTNLAGLVFGAIYPLLAPAPVLVPTAIGMCEPLHTSLVCPKNDGVLRSVTCDGCHSYRGRSVAGCFDGRCGSAPQPFPVAAEAGRPKRPAGPARPM